jgi:translocation and assembly module TamB
LATILLISGGVVLVGAAAAGWWAWRFINNQLAPLVAANLSTTFNRPVQVGKVEGVSLNQITFGQSSVPPTSTDPDRVTVESVKARFNLLEILWDRTLSLDVTLVHPNAYIEQDKNGLWITTKINQGGGKKPAVSIELDTLRLQDGTAQLAPYGQVKSSKPVATNPTDTAKSAVTSGNTPANEPATLSPQQAGRAIVGLQKLNGTVTFRNDNKLIAYDVTTQPETGGNLRLQGKTDLNASQTTLKVDSRDLLAADLSLLVPLPLKLQMGRLNTNLEVAFPPNNQPLQFNGTVGFQNVAARLDGAPQPFQQLNGGLRFRGQQVTFEGVEGRYGAVFAKVGGSLDTQKGYDLRVQVPRANVAEILQTVNLKQSNLPVALAGAFTAEATMTGPTNKPLVRGVVRNLQPVKVDRVSFAQTQAAFSVTPQAVVVNEFRAVPTGGGLITAQGNVKLGDRIGLVIDAQANNLPGDAIAAAYGASSPNFSVGRVDATAQVFGPLNNIQTVVQWQAPQATYPGRGRVVVADSTIQFEDTALLVANGIVRGKGQISNGRWQAVLNPSGIELSRFNPELRGLFSGDFRLAGSLSNLNPAAIQAEGQARFSQGLAIIKQPLQASVRWLGDRLQILNASAQGFSGNGFVFTKLTGPGAPAISNLDLNVALADYKLTDLLVTIPSQIRLAGTTDFQGKVTGSLNSIIVAGRLGLNNLAVNTFAFEPRLVGDFRYGLNRGLSLDVAGQQDRIAAVLDDRYRPRSFYLRQGATVAEGRSNGERLLASLRNFPLQALNIVPAANIGQVSGLLNGNFDINIANLSNPAVVGDVAIVNPAVGYITANALPASQPGEPSCLVPVDYQNQAIPCAKSLFTGRFRYANGAAVLEEGSQFRLGNSRYLLSGNFTPGADPQFRGRVVADEGRVEDLFALLQWFELSDLGRVGAPSYGNASNVNTVAVGLPQATLLNQLRRYSEIATLYRQQVIARENSSLFPELSTLRGGFSGTVDLAYSGRTGPSADFNLSGANWQWGQCPNPTSQITGLDQCQTYQIEQVVADGSFRNGVLELLPVSLQSGDSLFSFRGQVGGAQQSGQLEARNIPVAALRDLFRSPIDVEGNLTATATLGGSIENPQFEGELDLTEGKVNQSETIPPVRSLFGYNDARLTFFTRFVTADNSNPATANTANPANPANAANPNVASNPGNPNPANSATASSTADDDVFKFDGSIPYKLPFAKVEPDSYQANINLNIRNAGLGLINLFTDQVAWRSGEGDVQLQVAGQLPPDSLNFGSLTATGTASFTNAVIAAKALPKPLTNVNGNIRFEQNRIRVESLTGQFNNGAVSARGVIPLQYELSETDPDSNNPLVVNLDKLSIELANLYNGDVEGRILITGAALAPRIGGEIQLSNGRISIGPKQANVPTGATATASAPTGSTPNSSASPFARSNSTFTPPRYDGLQVSLGNRLRVTYYSLLNFLVQGNLLVSGTQADPLLDGTVRLRSGQVNLFTTQFNLVRGYRNTAVFDSSQGLDPTLDVRLVTSVPEVTRYPTQTDSPFPVSEIVDTSNVSNFGALQTVRVQASVTGPASQLFNNLELTSSPSRSQNEILALLGGGFLGNVQNNPTTALASIAGSPLLTSLQNLINDTLGISDFRLFPTTIIPENSRTSSLALAAELGFDITNDFSVSVLQLLTVPTSPQFSLRYRLTDQLLLRGSTNFGNESRAVLEFETRF